METKTNKRKRPELPEKTYSPKYRKYGYKKKQDDTEWFVPPIYDECRESWMGALVWVKKKGKFGLVDLNTGEEKIPCEYTFPPYFSREGLAVVWKDYKAGVINLDNEIVVPFIYDSITGRYRTPEDGFIGRIGDGDPICLNLQGEVTSFTQEELERMNAPWWIEEEFPEYMEKPIVEIEKEIADVYKEWDRKKTDDDLDKKLGDLIRIRARRLNQTWRHTPENAARIDRVNKLLMRAVRKAMTFGKRTAESLDWVKQATGDEYTICVFVYPYWQNRMSEWNGPVAEKVSRKVLDEDECELSEYHLWNIIVERGSVREENRGICFTHTAHTSNQDDWNFTSAVMDDGQTWDEGIHYPVYQDVYFVHPWHLLYWDSYEFALEDIARLNDFRVEVSVSFETKVKDKHKKKRG